MKKKRVTRHDGKIKKDADSYTKKGYNVKGIKLKIKMSKNSHNYYNVNPRILENSINPAITATIHIRYKMIFNLLEFILFAHMIPTIHKHIQHE